MLEGRSYLVRQENVIRRLWLRSSVSCEAFQEHDIFGETGIKPFPRSEIDSSHFPVVILILKDIITKRLQLCH